MVNSKLLDKLYKQSKPLFGEVPKKGRIPTLSPSVNWALQGGIVPGRFYGFFGPESAGKTMFAFSCCAQILKHNPEGVILWFDVEKALDEHWMKIFMSDEAGFTDDDRKRFICIPATYGREIFDAFLEKYVEEYHDQGLPILGCVIDSIQSILVPTEENRESTESQLMAPLARYLTGAIKAIIAPSRDRDIPWIFLSQVREVFDPMEKRMGKHWELTGGKAFHHFIDALLEFDQKKGKVARIVDESKMSMDGNPIQIGSQITMKVLGKCRVGVPNRTALFRFLYDKGIVDQAEEIADLAYNVGVVKIEGKTYFYGDKKVGVGKEDYRKRVIEDESLQNELYLKALETGNGLCGNR